MIENIFVTGYAFAIVLGCVSTYAAINGKTNKLATWKARRIQSDLARISYKTVAVVYGFLAAASYVCGLENLGTLLVIGACVLIAQTRIVRPYAAAWTKELDSVEHMFKSLKA